MTTAVVSIQDIAEQAAERFAQLGYPSTRNEEWKYTNVAPIARTHWRTSDPAVRGWETHDASMGGRAAVELVFVNGHLVERTGDDQPGLQVASLWGGALSAPGPAKSRPLQSVIEEHYAKYADYMRHPFTALNTANAQDGAVIVADGVIEGFVHLLFIGEGDEVWSHPRNLIIANRASQLTVVETYVGNGKYFTNAVTEIVAADGAVVDHTKIVLESRDAFHVGTVQIHQERSSSVTSRAITLGGAIVRAEANAALAGEGASLVLDGLFIANAGQHLDNHTVIEHAKPHCDSIELYKGILDGDGRGIFDGRIIVQPNAQKTVSRQTNKNLLLSESAIVDSKPTLEILNDDVKCNHGSTIGQLDEEALFYLRARGIGEDEARSLMIHAFASEIVDRIKVEPVRELVRRAMFRQMPERLPERRKDVR